MREFLNLWPKSPTSFLASNFLMKTKRRALLSRLQSLVIFAVSTKRLLKYNKYHLKQQQHFQMPKPHANIISCSRAICNQPNIIYLNYHNITTISRVRKRRQQAGWLWPAANRNVYENFGQTPQRTLGQSNRATSPWVVLVIFIIIAVFETKLVECGDVVIGKVDYISESGMLMHMVCFDNHKRRDLTNIKFDVYWALLSVLIWQIK